jgi:hypothetical protein
MSRQLMLGLAALIIFGNSTAQVQVPTSALPDQEILAEQLRSDNREVRSNAFQQTRLIPPESVGPALRSELIREVERTNALTRQSLAIGRTLSSVESGEYVAELHRVVAALRDPDSIPALANGLGIFTIIDYMVEWGEQAAPAVLDVVMDTGTHCQLPKRSRGFRY